jgi:hypothetical protein
MRIHVAIRLISRRNGAIVSQSGDCIGSYRSFNCVSPVSNKSSVAQGETAAEAEFMKSVLI